MNLLVKYTGITLASILVFGITMAYIFSPSIFAKKATCGDDEEFQKAYKNLRTQSSYPDTVKEIYNRSYYLAQMLECIGDNTVIKNP